MRPAFYILPAMLFVVTSWAAQAQTAPAPFARSATKARDIGGFALGMSIRDAEKLVPLDCIGGDDYQATKDGIKFDFGVSRLGRIYRVDSEQHLGRFAIDNAFSPLP